jgi:hypothetical protein
METWQRIPRGVYAVQAARTARTMLTTCFV